MEKCVCFFWHARTDEEREQAVKDLEYFRSIGDPVGTMMTLNSLMKCSSVTA